MLQPARQKFRKMQKGRNKGIATTGNKVSFGEFGLKAIGRGRLTARQIDGGPHKRWSMWFNSMQREEPYQGLTSCESLGNEGVPSGAQ